MNPNVNPSVNPNVGKFGGATNAAASVADLQSAKQVVWSAIQQMPGPNAAHAAAQWLSPNCEWHVAHPFNLLSGVAAVVEGFYKPLISAFPDVERRTDIFMAGHWDGHLDGGDGVWISCTGNYLGTFKGDFFGIPATKEAAYLRFGEFYRVVAGKIVEARILLDIIDLARQAGRPLLPPGTGLNLLVPGPRRHNGLQMDAAPPEQTAESFALVMAMIGGLMTFKGDGDLKHMGMTRYWKPNMMWYGPCGIGSSRGIGGFERHHQAPFLHAFPDRKGGNHRARFAEGPFISTTGWPSVRATHKGDYLGVPASNEPIQMRVMDWWSCEDGLLAENWVFIDLPHLMLQMGVDLLGRLKTSA